MPKKKKNNYKGKLLYMLNTIRTKLKCLEAKIDAKGPCRHYWKQTDLWHYSHSKEPIVTYYKCVHCNEPKVIHHKRG